MEVKNLPLAGLKVLDLSRVLAGPWCTQLLADMGADVIKVERPQGGDDTRQWGPPFWQESSLSAYFMCANRNKRSLALDLTEDSGRERFLKLAAQCDVLVENFMPKTRQKLSWLSADFLRQHNPRLIYCRISGFNSSSSHAERPGYDAMIQALSGLMSITGNLNGEPVKVGVAVTDLLTGLYAANGIQAALFERAKSGKGQFLEVSLMDVQVQCLANVLSAYLVSGQVPRALGSAHPQIVPYQAFATATRPIYLAVGNDLQFRQLSLAFKEKWHEDEQFATNPRRVENRQILVARIEQKLKAQDREYWLKLFLEHGVPSGPINNLEDMANDNYVRERNLLIKAGDHSTPFVRNPLEFSRTPLTRYECPPQLNDSPEAEFTFDVQETRRQ